ncbi:MAG: hypothetical protein JWR61_976 [Ferruginibacter sp.]|jgi:hypothetical protein|uniref:hypothetical protein n=1 Tax=Ferruginibacter sp. TaxID=1940288 RepID=UPI002658538C|nr:hypothetical protein [Ferruginibacter sp.]MDB5276021.1 hypothetical protein [Ferruginibacter sp.]
MKQLWFKRTNWTYSPIHPMGFIVTLMAILFMVPVTLATVHNTHSVSDNLYELFVYGTSTAFWWKWIADKTSAVRKY